MTDSLFLKKKAMKSWIQTFFADITLFCFFLSSLASSLSMTNQKSSTCWDWQKILYLLGEHIEIPQFFFQQETIFLILCSSLYQQSLFYKSKAWKCWETQIENYLLYTNNFYIKFMSYLLPYIVCSYDISKKHYYFICSRNLRKYKEEQPYKLQECFEPLILGTSRL